MDTNKIICGDSYKLIKEFPNNSVDCVYVDIPYLYGLGGGVNGSEISCNAKRRNEELIGNGIVGGIDYAIFGEFVRVMKKINCFVWCSIQQIYDVLKWWKENTKTTYQILTWNKTNPIPQCHANWLSDIEYCLYFNRGVHLNDGYEFKSKWYTSPINQADKTLYQHPTLKPVNLIKRHLLHTTQPNDLVVDFFVGGGSTCVAAKEIGRQYIGIEINPKWAKIAQDRLDGIDANGQVHMFAI